MQKADTKLCHDSRQLLPLNKNLDYYGFFSRKFVYFGIIGVLGSKITIMTIIPTQYSPKNWILRTKIHSVNNVEFKNYLDVEEITKWWIIIFFIFD